MYFRGVDGRQARASGEVVMASQSQLKWRDRSPVTRKALGVWWLALSIIHHTHTHTLSLSAILLLYCPFLLCRYRGQRISRDPAVLAAKRRKGEREVMISTVYDQGPDKADTLLRKAPTTTLKYRARMEFSKGGTLAGSSKT